MNLQQFKKPKPQNKNAYHRTKAQKRPEGSRQSAFDRSAMDAPPIEYKTTGSRV